MGNMQSQNCKPYIVADDVLVEYIEVTSTTYIDSLVFRFTNNYYSFWGKKKSKAEDLSYKEKRWDMSAEKQPVGLDGTEDQKGIISLSPYTYSMKCAELVLGIELKPRSQEYNDDPLNLSKMANQTRKNETVTTQSIWEELGSSEVDGVPILPIVISIAGSVALAILIGIICRCYYLRKKANKIKDGDFSVSEEE